MIVGEAMSSLTDSKDQKLDFHMEELNSDQSRWMKRLVQVSDTVGDTGILRPVENEVGDEKTKESPRQVHVTSTTRSAPRKPQIPKTSGFIIEEVDNEDEEEDEDADLKAYAKPDYDAEDSDDDPTMIRRDKPKPPVYVRDLIFYLRDTENYDHQTLGLSTAPILIRRKAKYGTEVKEHAQELAGLLVGLQDKYDIDDFNNLKLQSMIALIVAMPQMMGPWFARTFFEGDYSLSQRASVLTVLGLGARELAGFDTSEYTETASFPSKRLPGRVENLYVGQSSQQITASSPLKALPPNAIDSITQSLTGSILAPIAANAADAVTGPDVLKLSSFTSRLQATDGKISKAKSKPKIRNIPNTTAQLISTSFFFPLTARFQQALHISSARTRGILFQPMLLTLYLKTLALLLHAAGPSTLALPDMTTELWDLLLGSSIQAHCVGDLPVTHAVLFGLLTLLDINENRMRDLCQTQGKEVVQTQEWVAQVFEKTRGEDGGEENEVKMLAAGILIRLREGIEKYRMLLMGDMIG